MDVILKEVYINYIFDCYISNYHDDMCFFVAKFLKYLMR